MNVLEQLDRYSARLEDEINELENKIIELSADLGLYQNENENLTKDIEKYWGIEQELGCSLDVVFKALNEGIYIATEKIDFFLRPRLYFSDDYKNWCFELAFGGYVVHLKDYQKTWWLKGEKEC